MALESATYINQLVAANPLGSDPLADADGHLRLIKSTIQATFPNITGPVTVTQGTLNSPFPVGGIIMWSGATGSIPAGWLLCNGSNGTPDLRDRFIVGAGSTYAVGATGGSATTTLIEANLPAHTHSISIDSAGAHTHTITDPGHLHPYGFIHTTFGQPGLVGTPNGDQYGFNTGSATTGITINSNGAHTHTATIGSIGSGTAFSNLPPYYALAFIMKGAY